jgi:ADP-ribose pyrophosphatase YjhB (NUDIX family)
MSRIHLTVATVIKRKDAFLMVRETTPNRAGMEVFNQPAGHVETGETLTEAAIRETLEETGWLCEIKHPIGIYHYISPASGSQYLRMCFAADLIRQVHPEPLDDNILSAEWMTLSALNQVHHLAQQRAPSATPSRRGSQAPTDTVTTTVTTVPPTSRPNRAPEVLRSPVVLTCCEDYDRGVTLPWHCLQEQPLQADRSSSPTVPIASAFVQQRAKPA